MVNALMTSISREPDCDVHRRDWRWPLNVDTGRPLCANTGRSQTARQTGEVDPKATFKISL